MMTLPHLSVMYSERLERIGPSIPAVPFKNIFLRSLNAVIHSSRQDSITNRMNALFLEG